MYSNKLELYNNLPPIVRFTAFAALGSVLAAVAFSGSWQTLAFAGLLTIFVQFTNSRAETFALCLAYYMTASRGLPSGISNYLGDQPIPAISLWLAANAISAGVHTLLWTRSRARRAWLSIASLLLLAMPPFGVTGWASPLVASGTLFPSLGFGGILQFLVFLLLIKFRFVAASIVTGMLALGANLGITEPRNSWKPYSTHQGQESPPPEVSDQLRNQINLASRVQDHPARSVLLPESAVPHWNGITQNLWTAIISGRKTVGIGTVLDSPGEKRRQAVVYISEGNVAVYRQRQPVPITMWMPWSSDGFAAGWFDNPIVNLPGQRLATFVCYESFLVWPVLHSAAHNPQRFLVSSNLWWAQGTNILELQDAIIHTWARLFHVPYTLASNT